MVVMVVYKVPTIHTAKVTGGLALSRTFFITHTDDRGAFWDFGNFQSVPLSLTVS